MNNVIRFALMYVIVPLWGMAGLADWLCHRRAHIAEHDGAKESMIHLLMLAEISIPVVAGLFLDVNALLIAAMIGFLCLHRITMMWDIRHAQKHREVTKLERHVHATMEILALAALLSIIALHFSQFLALLGLGSENARFTLAPKPHRLPPLYSAVVLFNLVVMELLPYLQELYKGLKIKKESH